MFEENNLMETSENVEQTTEQTETDVIEGEEAVEEPVKMYTEEEFNARMDELLPKKLERAKAKMRREFEEEYAGYKEVEVVLNAGLGTTNINDAKNELTEFYKQRGIDIPRYQPEAPQYSDEEAEVLAIYEAQKIIDAGMDEVIDEVNRLANKGLENMNAREKQLFSQLAEHRKYEQDKAELAQMGVKADILDDEEFQEFEEMLNPSLSITDKYNMYRKTKQKTDFEPIGSMKGSKAEPAVKDFYTFEEASKFTREDFDKNPALFKAVERSMQMWK